MKITLKRLALVIAGAGLLTLYGCGGGEDDTSSDISNVAAQSGGSATCAAQFPDTMATYSSRLAEYKNDGQCSPQIQAAEANRQSAIANCSAGDTASAATIYSNYKKSVTLVNAVCP